MPPSRVHSRHDVVLGSTRVRHPAVSNDPKATVPAGLTGGRRRIRRSLHSPLDIAALESASGKGPLAAGTRGSPAEQPASNSIYAKRNARHRWPHCRCLVWIGEHVAYDVDGNFLWKGDLRSRRYGGYEHPL